MLGKRGLGGFCLPGGSFLRAGRQKLLLPIVSPIVSRIAGVWFWEKLTAVLKVHHSSTLRLRCLPTLTLGGKSRKVISEWIAGYPIAGHFYSLRFDQIRESQASSFPS